MYHITTQYSHAYSQACNIKVQLLARIWAMHDCISHFPPVHAHDYLVAFEPVFIAALLLAQLAVPSELLETLSLNPVPDLHGRAER